MYDKFPDLEPFLLRLIETNTSVANANRLYEMLIDEVKGRFIRISLAAILECLEPMCKFCYKMEGDGQLAGKRVDELHTHYNGGDGLPALPSVRRLVEESLEFVQGNEEYVRPPANIPPPLTFQQIQAANPRPRHQAAINGVNAAVGALMTDAQRQNRDRRAAVQFGTMLEAHQAQVDAAIAQAADDMTRYPPQTVEEWNHHVSVGIKPAIDYLFSRISLGGERYQMVQFYRAARIFDPMYAVTIDYETARTLIKDLRVYDALNEDNTIAKLIRTFLQFKEKALRIQNPSGDVDILQWHHDNCAGNHDLKVWFDACAKVVLVQPSSAASERVFSLLNQFWGINKSIRFQIQFCCHYSYLTTREG